MPDVVQHLVGFLVAHGIGLLETGDGVAVAEFAIQRHDGRMAMNTGTGLRLGLALGLLLIL